MNISEISGTMVSDPSTATNQIIVDTGDGLQRAIATSAVSGTIVSDESIETTDCIVDTGSGLQKAVKVAGSGGGGGGSSTKYGASIDNFLGDVDENGVLLEPTSGLNLVFTGVKVVDDEIALDFPQMRTTRGTSSIAGVPTVLSASFPDLEEVKEDGFREAFSKTGIESVSFPKLKYIRAKSGSNYNYYAFSGTFNNGSSYHPSSAKYEGGLKTVSFPELEEISGVRDVFYSCFSNNRELTSVSFPKLKYIHSSVTNAFGSFYVGSSQSPQITTTEMPALEEVTANMYFYQNSSIETANFPSLKKAGNQAFGGSYSGGFMNCYNLTSASFPVLDDINNYMVFAKAFSGDTALTSVSFGGLKSTSFGSSYTNQFNNMLSGCTGVTVHFPSNVQSVIGSWSDVTAGFGGTNTTVLFDLPATE